MKHGFSLVELSIVLVILGLLTGGILAGQNLIRASELRAVTTEYERYVSAVNTFRDKYFALPGDMRNATDFWPTATNGDSDGYLEYLGSNTENYQFWTHLQQAGLIEGSLTGAVDATNASTIGENTPRSKAGNAGWDAFGLPNPPTTASGFAGACETIWANFGNALTVGGFRASYWHQAPAFKPEEAWNIDTKMDDGRPSYGKITASQLSATCFTGSWTSCQIRPQDVTGYALTNSNVGCALTFNNAF